MPFVDRNSFEAVLEFGPIRADVLVKLMTLVDASIKRHHREGYFWVDDGLIDIKGGDYAVLVLAGGEKEAVRITGTSWDVGVNGSTLVVNFLSAKNWKGEVD